MKGNMENQLIAEFEHTYNKNVHKFTGISNVGTKQKLSLKIQNNALKELAKLLEVQPKELEYFLCKGVCDIAAVISVSETADTMIDEMNGEDYFDTILTCGLYHISVLTSTPTGDINDTEFSEETKTFFTKFKSTLEETDETVKFTPQNFK